MVEDGVHDSLGHVGNIGVLFLLTDIKRSLKDPFDTNSLFEHNIKIRNLELEVIGSFALARNLSWDLVEDSLHEATDDHSLLF